jgi:hypothetical protein
MKIKFATSYSGEDEDIIRVNKISATLTDMLSPIINGVEHLEGTNPLEVAFAVGQAFACILKAAAINCVDTGYLEDESIKQDQFLSDVLEFFSGVFDNTEIIKKDAIEH